MSPETVFPLSLSLTPLIGWVSATPPPKSMTKEWQEASNERARELNLDPMTGKCTDSLVPSSEFLCSFGFAFRCPLRRLLGEGIRAIQVDIWDNLVGSRADPLGRVSRLCFILGHNQTFVLIASFLP